MATTNKKQKLLNRFGNRCAYCGKTVKPSKMTMDHVIPRSKGGKGVMNNLLPACSACNHAKGSLDLEIFRMKYFWQCLPPAALKDFDTAMKEIAKHKFYFEKH